MRNSTYVTNFAPGSPETDVWLERSLFRQQHEAAFTCSWLVAGCHQLNRLPSVTAAHTPSTGKPELSGVGPADVALIHCRSQALSSPEAAASQGKRPNLCQLHPVCDCAGSDLLHRSCNSLDSLDTLPATAAAATFPNRGKTQATMGMAAEL